MDQNLRLDHLDLRDLDPSLHTLLNDLVILPHGGFQLCLWAPNTEDHLSIRFNTFLGVTLILGVSAKTPSNIQSKSTSPQIHFFLVNNPPFRTMVNKLLGWWLTHPSEKWWTSSVGMMNFPIYGKIKMFQTTNQVLCMNQLTMGTVDPCLIPCRKHGP